MQRTVDRALAATILAGDGVLVFAATLGARLWLLGPTPGTLVTLDLAAVLMGVSLGAGVLVATVAAFAADHRSTPKP